MHFTTDENVHPDVAASMRQEGHDAVRVWDEAMRSISDANLAQVCRNEGRILMTFDFDFADIRLYPPGQFAGIIILRLASQDRRHVLRSLARLLPMLTESGMSGHLWIVDEHNVRVRGEDEP